MALSILSVAYPFAPVAIDPVGGAEQVLARLDRMLVESGYRSTVIAMEASRICGQLVEIASVRGVIDEVSRVRAYTAVRRAIEQILEREPIDVIHIHAVDFAGYLPPAGVPVVITLHLPLNTYPASVLHATRPDTWLVPVSRTQACTAPGLQLLAPIENGVEIPAPAPHARRSYTLVLGRVCPEKNFADAIDAARLAGYPLLLAGSVFNYREHESYFTTHIAPRLDHERRWIGPIAGARKRRLLAGARCVLVPSRVAETSSLVAMEALAAGTPVIAYRAGALPEIVDHGRTGFVVDDSASMAEAIRRIDEIDREECRRTARERYSLERMTGAYRELYERLAAANRSIPRRDASPGTVRGPTPAAPRGCCPDTGS